MPAQTDHPSFPQPLSKNTKIWRYMDFTKFVSLISSNSLFFNRSDLFEDTFEGSFPKRNPILRQRNLEDYMSDNDAQRSAETSGDIVRAFKQWTYINCWHANEHESAAMWKLYSKINESIAIESTYADLKNVLQDDIYLGLVKYIDYDTELIPEGNIFNTFMYKRKSFEHEKEVRALLQRPPSAYGEIQPYRENEKYGVNIDINLNQLIKKIYVAPDAPNWLLELTEEISRKYNITADVQKSNLNEEPIF